MKKLKLLFTVVIAVFLLHGCNTLLESSSEIVTGELIWAGSPATDGAGMLFTTADTTYGVPGSREDYARYFPNDQNSVEIRAMVRVTGETTVRGWGSRFPEGILSRIVVL